MQQNVQQKPRKKNIKKELTFDFREQNKTKDNRISFLVLFGLTFEKTTENESKELIQKSI